MSWLRRCGDLAGWSRLVAQVFFAHFFSLLLLGVSVAQWASAAWVLALCGVLFSAPVHVVAAATIYAVNRRLIGSMRRRRGDRGWRPVVLRAYSAVAFTSLFCAIFLGVSAIAWGLMRVVLGALTVQASTMRQVAAGTAVDVTFRWFSVAGVGTIVMAFIYGFTLGQRRLAVNSLRVPLNYAPALNGLRIAHVSDIHLGHNLAEAQLRGFVEQVNALSPDLICITGDIADGPTTELPGQVPLLGELRAKYGVFAILGNHDHYAGASRVEAALRRDTDFTVLRDTIASVEIQGARLQIVGLDDVGRDWARGVSCHPALKRLTVQLSPGEPVLLLTHRPEPFAQAASLGIGLTLAGHTHGGQISIPWLDGRRRGLAWFVTEFDQGLFERDGSYLYVSRGLGVTGQRIRLFTPREISVIEVDSATAILPAA
jgi:uncharacterized protein